MLMYSRASGVIKCCGYSWNYPISSGPCKIMYQECKAFMIEKKITIYVRYFFCRTNPPVGDFFCTIAIHIQFLFEYNFATKKIESEEKITLNISNRISTAYLTPRETCMMWEARSFITSYCLVFQKHFYDKPLSCLLEKLHGASEALVCRPYNTSTPLFSQCWQR